MTEVLVVEDDLSLREVLVEALQMEGVTTAVASNGAEALVWLRAAPRLPAVILLDLMMPVMDGASFRQEQRADAVLSQVPVVLISADRGLADKAWALQVDTWLRKPVDLDELMDAVRRHST